jgi:hypothetical protein
MPPKRVRKVPTKRTANDSLTAAPKPPLKRRVTKTPKVTKVKAITELEEKQKLLSATTLRATRMSKTPEPKAGPSNANNVLPEDLLKDNDVFGSNPKDKKGKGPASDSSATNRFSAPESPPGTFKSSPASRQGLPDRGNWPVLA